MFPVILSKVLNRHLYVAQVLLNKIKAQFERPIAKATFVLAFATF